MTVAIIASSLASLAVLCIRNIRSRYLKIESARDAEYHQNLDRRIKEEFS